MRKRRLLLCKPNTGMHNIILTESNLFQRTFSKNWRLEVVTLMEYQDQGHLLEEVSEVNEKNHREQDRDQQAENQIACHVHTKIKLWLILTQIIFHALHLLILVEFQWWVRTFSQDRRTKLFGKVILWDSNQELRRISLRFSFKFLSVLSATIGTRLTDIPGNHLWLSASAKLKEQNQSVSIRLLMSSQAQPSQNQARKTNYSITCSKSHLGQIMRTYASKKGTKIELLLIWKREKQIHLDWREEADQQVVISKQSGSKFKLILGAQNWMMTSYRRALQSAISRTLRALLEFVNYLVMLLATSR